MQQSRTPRKHGIGDTAGTSKTAIEGFGPNSSVQLGHGTILEIDDSTSIVIGLAFGLQAHSGAIGQRPALAERSMSAVSTSNTLSSRRCRLLLRHLQLFALQDDLTREVASLGLRRPSPQRGS